MDNKTKAKELFEISNIKLNDINKFIIKNEKNYSKYNNIKSLNDEMIRITDRVIDDFTEINENQRKINDLLGKVTDEENSIFNIKRICTLICSPFLNKINRLYLRKYGELLPMPITLKNNIEVIIESKLNEE